MISTGSKSSRIPSLPNTPSQTNKPENVYLARSWISVPCSPCKTCRSVFVAKPQLGQLPADIIKNFVKDYSPGCFPWPPLSLRISWNFWTRVLPAPRHLVPYSETFLDVPDAFWAFLTSTTPSDKQGHILSIPPGNPLSFYAQNWVNLCIFILTWKNYTGSGQVHNSQVTFQCPQSNPSGDQIIQRQVWAQTSALSASPTQFSLRCWVCCSEKGKQ